MADNGDNPSFDVYGMLLVLGFIATGAATFILYTDLDENWNFGRKDMKVAVNVTQMNDDPKTHSDVFVLTKQDLEDWQRINKNGKFPIEGYEWPAGFDPYTNKVKPDTNNLEIKEEVRKALLGGDAESVPSPAPAPAPTTPPTDAATPPADKAAEKAPEKKE